MPESYRSDPRLSSSRISHAGRELRRWSRFMFYAHLWLGVTATALFLVLALTGILLNHKKALGFMPEVPHHAGNGLRGALPLLEFQEAAGKVVPSAVAEAGIDRMDVRPDDGLVKVRFDDLRVTEVTLDLHSGAVLHVGERNDVFLEKLHSGEIFGGAWTLLSDAGAVLLLTLVATGYWLWLYPKSRL